MSSTPGKIVREDSAGQSRRRSGGRGRLSWPRPPRRNRLSACSFDTILRNGRIAGLEHGPVDIGGARTGASPPSARHRKRACRTATREFRAGWAFADCGFCRKPTSISTSHASRIAAPCRTGTLKEAIENRSPPQNSLSTEEDIYARAKRTLEKAIVQGTTRMAHPCRGRSTHRPEKAFAPSARLKRDYAWAIDLEICAFSAGRPSTNDPGTFELLVEGLRETAPI